MSHLTNRPPWTICICTVAISQISRHQRLKKQFLEELTCVSCQMKWMSGNCRTVLGIGVGTACFFFFFFCLFGLLNNGWIIIPLLLFQLMYNCTRSNSHCTLYVSNVRINTCRSDTCDRKSGLTGVDMSESLGD